VAPEVREAFTVLVANLGISTRITFRWILKEYHVDGRGVDRRYEGLSDPTDTAIVLRVR
jgi:hypothetical protein